MFIPSPYILHSLKADGEYFLVRLGTNGKNLDEGGKERQGIECRNLRIMELGVSSKRRNLTIVMSNDISLFGQPYIWKLIP